MEDIKSIKTENIIIKMTAILLCLVIGFSGGYYLSKQYSPNELDRVIDSRRLDDIEFLAILNLISASIQSDDIDYTYQVLCAHMHSILNNTNKLEENSDLQQQIYNQTEKHITWLIDNNYCDDYVKQDY